MRNLSNAEVQQARYEPGRSLLLFLTDRCPVGCAHCSVDSRRDSPKITDFTLFESLVEGICADTRRDIVGISGGEPFVERRGLTLAMTRLAAAGKRIVLYTSGVWARSGRQAPWITKVLPLASCVFLSTDAFHTEAIDDPRFVAAARAVADAGVWLVVQVLEEPEQVQHAAAMLTAAFGLTWPEYAEINEIPPLPYGRAAGMFALPPLTSAQEFGPCRSLASPVVRYDGRVSACCNERVIMAGGPARLRRTVADARELTETLSDLEDDALLGAIATAGPSAVTAVPGYTHLSDARVRGICDLCWRLQDATAQPLGDRSNRMLTLLPLVASKTLTEAAR